MTPRGSSGGAEPPPTMNREKVCMIINAISIFHSRGRACPARGCRVCKPKNLPPKLCGPAMQAFKLDGYHLMYPGDSSAPGYLVYNCRCTTVAVVDGVDTGGYNAQGERPGNRPKCACRGYDL